ncbi:MAG TPA: TolC family protein [Terriglobales bacterium]|nr:TolC family protein [Terriglobales bacterium]
MKPAFNLIPVLFCFFLASAAIGAPSANAEPLTLKRAVDLALTHSPASGQAAADEQRAFASFRETRDQFIPQLLIGSGLGDSWGYPLSLEGSAPSLVNMSAQSALFNPALRNGMRAARSEYKAAQIGTKDRRNQIIQDTTLAYLELLKWQQMTTPLQQQRDDAANMEQVVQQRIQQGIDSPSQGTEARLSTARAKLRYVQAQGAIDELRSTLSQLTGLPPASIEAVPESVPALPETPSDSADSATPLTSNPAVLFADEHARAETFKARAEHLALWPSVDFASQYAVLAKFNNWLQFFPSKAFERNNATIGVVIRFPFFNASQHAHAEAADAEAVRARKEAEATKNQVSQETLKLRHSVEQLGAAKEVSELEYEIAKSEVDAVQIRMNSGNATVHDSANARLQLAEKYNALQDADFQLQRARIGLLRTTGGLETWVEQSR